MALLLPRRKAGAVDISTVFSTDLYTGNGSTQTITNGIDLSGEGGLVWIKSRSTATDNYLTDTERGASQNLFSNSTQGQVTSPTSINSFLSDGFDLLGSSNNNVNTRTYASWTFRKSPNFFDVVTYTGDGTSSRSISHNLGTDIGWIVIKRTDSADTWYTIHRTFASGNGHIDLNETNPIQDATGVLVGLSDTDFTLGVDFGATIVNASGASYVAYLFAHDTTDNGVIQCGSYTGNGSSSGPTVTLGWEPQWILVKRATNIAVGTGDWQIYDQARGLGPGADFFLEPNTSDAEGNGSRLAISSTGFSPDTPGGVINALNETYIYVAIRKEGV